MRIRLCFTFLCLTSIFFQATIGQDNKSTTTKTAAPKAELKVEESTSPTYGSISGRVMSEDGPLPFVQVSVFPVSNRNRGNTFRTTTTDAEGNFKIDGLQALAWNLLSSARGYIVETTDDEAALSFHRIGDQVTVRMLKGGVITGRVLSAAGEPIIAVSVSAQMVRDPQGQPASSLSGGGIFQTDDRGVYRIYGLSPGNYVVEAGRTGGGGGGPRQSPYDGDAPTYFPSATRDTAVEVSVGNGAEANGIDIQYRGDKGFAISGKITGAVAETNSGRGGFGGTGGGGIAVTLSHAATGTFINRTFVQSRDGNNSYSMYGVPNGEYEVIAQRNSPGDNDAASAPRKITVSGRNATGMDLVLVPLASITARLQIENENNAIKCEVKRKASFAEQLFSLHPEEAKKNISASTQRRGLSDGTRPVAPENTGIMAFQQLSPGRYRLLPQLLDDNWYVRSLGLSGVTVKATAKAPTKTTLLDVGRNGIGIKSGDKITGLVVKVSEGAAMLKGKIKAENDAALHPQLHVYLVPVEKEKIDDALRYVEGSISHNGSFAMKNLAPGKYWLVTRVETDEANILWNAAERTKLRREAELANTVIELQPCQRVLNYELRLKKK